MGERATMGTSLLLLCIIIGAALAYPRRSAASIGREFSDRPTSIGDGQGSTLDSDWLRRYQLRQYDEAAGYHPVPDLQNVGDHPRYGHLPHRLSSHYSGETPGHVRPAELGERGAHPYDPDLLRSRYQRIHNFDSRLPSYPDSGPDPDWRDRLREEYDQYLASQENTESESESANNSTNSSAEDESESTNNSTDTEAESGSGSVDFTVSGREGAEAGRDRGYLLRRRDGYRPHLRRPGRPSWMPDRDDLVYRRPYPDRPYSTGSHEYPYGAGYGSELGERPLGVGHRLGASGGYEAEYSHRYRPVAGPGRRDLSIADIRAGYSPYDTNEGENDIDELPMYGGKTIAEIREMLLKNAEEMDNPEI